MLVSESCYNDTMIKVFTDERLFILVQLKQQLIDAGLSCFIKNELLAGGTGELPFIETWPELWLHNQADYNQAMVIVNDFKKILDNGENAPDWACPQCGENNEGHYGLCWSCGHQLTPEAS
ncbi:MAG: DUF2007 domain-containing protein [Proteobacteria bacterium]|nr:MAG: DUF2007 domain-containing protein [Pseudomonadota bacterium]